ncbi:MAG TPA: hypothetical protein VIV65_07485 [Gemmatimonadaceae bacterium]
MKRGGVDHIPTRCCSGSDDSLAGLCQFSFSIRRADLCAAKSFEKDCRVLLRRGRGRGRSNTATVARRQRD